MIVVGLTGGMACGKSFVAAALAGMGCHVVEADALGHDVLLPGGAAYSGVVGHFGDEILDAQGRIDRARLATLVFSDPVQLAWLNGMVHPAVRALAEQRFHDIAAQDPRAIVIYVAAILVETGSHRDFFRLIAVTCSPAQQFERAMARPGAREDDVRARLARQIPNSQKTGLADYVIDTSGTREETLRQTEIVFEELSSAS